MTVIGSSRSGSWGTKADTIQSEASAGYWADGRYSKRAPMATQLTVVVRIRAKPGEEGRVRGRAAGAATADARRGGLPQLRPAPGGWRRLALPRPRELGERGRSRPALRDASHRSLPG